MASITAFFPPYFRPIFHPVILSIYLFFLHISLILIKISADLVVASEPFTARRGLTNPCDSGKNRNEEREIPVFSLHSLLSSQIAGLNRTSVGLKLKA